MSAIRKVLHLTHDMGIGGTEQVIKQLIVGLDRDQVECQVLCLDGEVGPLGVQLRDLGFTVETLQRKPGFDMKLVQSIRKILARDGIDILHCHQYTPFTYGVLAALLTPVRVVYTEHGRFHPDRYSWKRRLLNSLLNQATDGITAISVATSKALVKYEWFPAKSIRVIYNGIKDQGSLLETPGQTRLTLPEGALVFGTISRFDSIKNHEMMIDAFGMVSQSRPEAHLVMVGDGPERSALEQRVKSLGVGHRVHFTGFQLDTHCYLSLMDIFLLSSFSEGTSMTLLEAMSGSKACVVTAVGGNVELIQHEVNGFLSASGDTAGFAQNMLRLASDARLMESFGQAARKTFLDRFDIAYMLQAYQGIYLKLVRKEA